MSVTPLVDVVDARVQLNIDATDSHYDDELVDYILAATEIVNSKCGYSAATPITETVFSQAGSFSRVRFILNRTPIMSVTSITPTQDGLIAPDMSKVTFDPDTGVVYMSNYMAFYGTFTVSYVAGRTEVPPALRMAALLIVQDMWETQRSASPLPTPGDPGGDLAAYAQDRGLPARALQLMRIAPYSAAPGIA